MVDGAVSMKGRVHERTADGHDNPVHPFSRLQAFDTVERLDIEQVVGLVGTNVFLPVDGNLHGAFEDDENHHQVRDTRKFFFGCNPVVGSPEFGMERVLFYAFFDEEVAKDGKAVHRAKVWKSGYSKLPPPRAW